MTRSKKNILVVLDRDGTINYDPGFFGKDENWRKNIKILPGVPEGIKKLNKIAYVVVASNQFGVARGYFTLKRVKEINRAIDKIFKIQGAIINGWHNCPYVEKSWAQKEGLDLNTPWVKKTDSRLRKPDIGMIIKAARELKLDFKRCRIYSVGNRFIDAEMGVRAGGKGIIIKDPKYLKEFSQVLKLSKKDKTYAAVNNFLEAVKVIFS